MNNNNILYLLLIEGNVMIHLDDISQKNEYTSLLRSKIHPQENV
jgi:hypothetical protein